jgi:hypothetical protein
MGCTSSRERIFDVFGRYSLHLQRLQGQSAKLPSGLIRFVPDVSVSTVHSGAL